MKLAAKDAHAAFKGLVGTQNIVFAYGEDAGGVNDVLKSAEQAICGKSGDPQAARVIIRPEDISGDNAKLADEAAQPNFFGDLKILRVGPVTDSHLAALKAVTEGPRTAFVLIEAGSLGPRSKLRQYFEKSKNAHAIACYRDDARDVGRLIDDVLTSNGVMLSRDARQYLQSLLGADRAVTRSELEKIRLYAGEGTSKEPLEIQTIAALIGDSTEHTADDIAAAALSGQAAQADVLLSKAMTRGVNSVEITRALSRRVVRLLTALAYMEQGESVDGAMKKLRPPVFWKDKTAFQFQLQHWTAPALEQSLSALNDVEKTIKSDGPSHDALLGRAILSIGGQMRRSKH